MKRSSAAPWVAMAVTWCLAGCRPAPVGDCVVNGTVQGIRNGPGRRE
jgi:hypothetical protein